MSRPADNFNQLLYLQVQGVVRAQELQTPFVFIVLFVFVCMSVFVCLFVFVFCFCFWVLTRHFCSYKFSSLTIQLPTIEVDSVAVWEANKHNNNNIVKGIICIYVCTSLTVYPRHKGKGTNNVKHPGSLIKKKKYKRGNFVKKMDRGHSFVTALPALKSTATINS